jgi:hypothetical protein
MIEENFYETKNLGAVDNGTLSKNFDDSTLIQLDGRNGLEKVVSSDYENLTRFMVTTREIKDN